MIDGERDSASLRIRASLSPAEAEGVAIGTRLPVQFVTESGRMCPAIIGRVTSFTPTLNGATDARSIEIEIEVDAAQLRVITVDGQDAGYSAATVRTTSDSPKLVVGKLAPPPD